ncbi:glycosyltransferase family 4 protein [Rhodocytophaga rosea]|uniref:Glycosyltransferase family 4 protein n=1 Tax=Rhodocytophaga rosea TaxID=2704465 RepID=A0A6C0GDJ8_9BACT|nr:glycosyltransferase family 1 protein [Rhodocytophaga rosea]QHT65760.1 glycosyltransferase family 4 protein [Rhodocytophaga rosea]
MKDFTVIFFQRKPRTYGNFSIEILFEAIRSKLPPFIHSKTVISKYESNGLWKRIYNTIEAYFRQGDINHVTGDVHFLTFLLKKKKTILTIHDCGFMNHPSRVARQILKLFWLKFPIARSELITVVSQATKDDILKHISCNPKKIVVIPNFILPGFNLFPKEFNSKQPRLLHIGTAPNKNLERLIEAIQGIDCQLDIIGKLNERQFKLLNNYNIQYTNYYNLTELEIIQRYHQCDILTFVSTFEGFGVPILEAQAIERAVITSSISSMPEVAGDGACLVDPYNVIDIRQGILRIIKDEEYRNQIIYKGKENVKHFKLEVIIKQYVNLYEQLLHS